MQYSSQFFKSVWLNPDSFYSNFSQQLIFWNEHKNFMNDVIIQFLFNS